MGMSQLLPMLLQKIMSANKGPMSEQPPGMTTPFGMPGGGGGSTMPSVSPQIQQMQQQMQNQAQIFGQQPNATAASQQGPLQGPRNVRPGEVGQTEWSTRSGKNMAITEASVESFRNAFQVGEQKNWNRSAAQAEQLWQSYRSLNQALEETQDPKAKEAIKKQLDAMMEDPKTQKIMKKAHQDPTSAYGVGLQRAMQQSKQEAKEQAALEEVYSKIQLQQQQAQAEKQRAAQEASTAHLRDVQAAQSGQITPKVGAELQNKKDIVQMQVDQQKDHWAKWAQAESDRTKAMIQMNNARIKAMKDTKGQDKAIKYFQTQATELGKQLTDLDKQQKDIQDNITKVGTFGDLIGHQGDDLRARLPALAQRRQQIQQAIDQLNNKIAITTQAGVIQMPPADPAPGVSQPPSGQITVPNDTIIVKPEDMQ
jgi:DNA repair exonuclease SbcCD ATPase subunit